MVLEAKRDRQLMVEKEIVVKLQYFVIRLDEDLNSFSQPHGYFEIILKIYM